MLRRNGEKCNLCAEVVEVSCRNMASLPTEVRRVKLKRFVESVRTSCCRDVVCLPYVRLKDKSVSNEEAVK